MSTGLDVQCRLDENDDPKAIKVSDAKINAININRDNVRGEWSDTISPTLAVSDGTAGAATHLGVD